MFVPIRYTIYSWSPPELSLQERIRLGGEISRTGRKAFVAALKSRLSARPQSAKSNPFTLADVLSDAEGLSSTNYSRPSPSVRAIVVAIIFFGGCFAAIAAIGLIVPLLVALAVIGPISVGSLLWMNSKVDRWVQSLVDEYTQSVVSGKLPTGRLSVSTEAAPPKSDGSASEEIAGLRRLAEQGQAAAQFRLGYMHAIGGGIEKNEREAVFWFRKAADQGYAAAQSNLGGMYVNGRGVEKDEHEAILWFRRAAEQGYAPGQCDLGAMYESGRGVEKNEREAILWFRKAAEQGYARGQFNLGVMYERGSIVAKNEREAVAWFRRAAEQGYAPAQAHLQLMKG